MEHLVQTGTIANNQEQLEEVRQHGQLSRSDLLKITQSASPIHTKSELPKAATTALLNSSNVGANVKK